MGFYLGLARFDQPNRTKWLLKAFLIPWLLHGTYDFMIMSGHPLLILTFIPFLIFMYRVGLKRMREFNDQSIFNPANINFTNQQENHFNQP